MENCTELNEPTFTKTAENIIREIETLVDICQHEYDAVYKKGRLNLDYECERMQLNKALGLLRSANTCLNSIEKDRRYRGIED